MKIKFVVVLVVFAISWNPTKASPSRTRRQSGWIWDQESQATPSPRPIPSPTPTPSNVTPSPAQLRQCIRDCPTTPQFNPVCGTNGVSYDNEAKLKCARKCGAGDIAVAFMGTCS